MKKYTRGDVRGRVAVPLGRKPHPATGLKLWGPVKVYTAEERARLQASMKSDAEARHSPKPAK